MNECRKSIPTLELLQENNFLKFWLSDQCNTNMTRLFIIRLVLSHIDHCAIKIKKKKMLNFYVKLKGVRWGKSIRRFIFHLVQYYKPLNKLPCVGGCCERTFFLFLFRWRGVGFLLASGEVWGRFGQPLHEILSQHDQDQGRYRKRDRTIWQSELVIVCWPWMFFYVRPPQ